MSFGSSTQVQDASQDNAEEVQQPDDVELTPSQKKKRGKKQGKAPRMAQAEESLDGSPAKTKALGRGKGWRQTPMLQQSTASFQPYKSLKRAEKRGPGGGAGGNNENGWASEDVTDVQELGDFDFEGGLAKFDKRGIFDQMRRDDQVDEADRLVSHNRQAKPGTAGGKNLHHSENVLEVPSAAGGPSGKGRASVAADVSNDFWNSEADDGVRKNKVGGEQQRGSGREQATGSGAGAGGGRSSSRRGEGKTAAGASRRSQSRKAAGVAGPSRINSGGVRNNTTTKLTITSPGPVFLVMEHDRRHQHGHKVEAMEVVDGQEQTTRRRANTTRIVSLQIGGNQPQATGATSATNPASAAQAAGAFYACGRRIETVSALQMLNLENIAHNEMGLTESMMTENAGRGVAEVALVALSDPAIMVRSPDMFAKKPAAGGTTTTMGAAAAGATGPSATRPTTPPSATLSAALVVVLAGNNKSGTRAAAAARHLRSRGVSVLLCVVGLERERDLLEDLRAQLRVYRALGGRVYSKLDLFEHLRTLAHRDHSARQKMDTPGPPGGGGGGGVAGVAGLGVAGLDDRPLGAGAGGGEGDAGAPGSGGGRTVMLIVDALLGLAVSFEELRTSDQATVYELIEWANRNEAFVLAVDVPTGIDPSTGRVALIDGGRLYVKPRYVVAVGAPKKGLAELLARARTLALGQQARLRGGPTSRRHTVAGVDGSDDEDAYEDDEEEDDDGHAAPPPRRKSAVPGTTPRGDDEKDDGDDVPALLAAGEDDVLEAAEWKLFVADMGLGAAVWKKAGTKLRKGVDFGDRWVREMRYRAGEAPDEE